MNASRITLFATLTTALGLSFACEPLAEPRDVSGNYTLDYADNLRIYIDDTLVAEVEAGENAIIEWNGQTFDIEAVCGDDGTTCPSEAYWGSMGIEQPWGTGNRLLNFINLDASKAPLGQRMGGTLADDGTFGMLAGLDLSGAQSCASLGVGVVEGRFTNDDQGIEQATIAFGWAGGCQFGDATISAEVRIETDVTGRRTGPLDLSDIEAEPPIDENGEDAGDAPTAE